MNPTFAIAALALTFLLNASNAQVAPAPKASAPRLTATDSALPKPPADSSSSNSANMRIEVQQRLDKGTRMSATLSATLPQDPGVPVVPGDSTIKNNNGTKPTWVGTVTGGNQGVAFTIPGIVNGRIVTDVVINGEKTIIPTGVKGKTRFLTLAAFIEDGFGGLKTTGLGEWLANNSYVSPAMLAIPDFTGEDVEDIYYGVDLAVWSARGFAVGEASLGTVYDIVNGLSSFFPGFVFSAGPITYNEVGFVASTPFSGIATLDAYTLVAAVPEPGTVTLVGIAVALIVFGRRWRERRVHRGGICSTASI